MTYQPEAIVDAGGIQGPTTSPLVLYQAGSYQVETRGAAAGSHWVNTRITGASSSDYSQFRYARASITKWSTGNNVAGDGADNFTINRDADGIVSAATAMKITRSNLRVDFYGDVYVNGVQISGTYVPLAGGTMTGPLRIDVATPSTRSFVLGDGTDRYFQTYGSRLLHLGRDSTPLLTDLLTRTAVDISIQGDATRNQASIYLTGYYASGQDNMTTMMYQTGGDRGFRLAWNYREPYQDNNNQMHSDPAYPVIQTSWETDGAFGITYTKPYTTSAGTYDGLVGKSFKLFGGGFPGGAAGARGKYTSFVVGQAYRGMDFQVVNNENASDYVARLRIDPYKDSSGAGANDNPIWLYVNGALKQVTVGAADSGGSGFRLLRVAN